VGADLVETDALEHTPKRLPVLASPPPIRPPR
jgi:hypothetical protein